jgi:UDP-N-acetylmuramyl pentapeptide phosphotransferase/UDP-N-acetylglucosamine-1-phosphate transferase
MVEMLMSLALAFGITFYAIPVIINVSNQKRLFDLPDERKIHRNPIPSIGGLGIFAGFITALLLTVTFRSEVHHFQYLVAALMVIFFVGIKDDLINLSPLKKFLGQILAATILVFKGGFVIQNMDGILGIHELPLVGSYSLSMITIVVIINAYNLIDGVDGLAASLSLMSSIMFAVFFAINDQLAYACIATSLAGALAAFLIFNFNPAKIFMGDTGSLILGLINAVLVIQFINSNAVVDNGAALQVKAGPAVGFAILFVPLFDTLRVFSLRILHGESPFTPDRNHIHHILLRLGLGHKQVTCFLLIANLIIASSAYYLQLLGSNWLLTGLLMVGFTTVALLVNIYGRRRVRLVDGTITSSRLAKGKLRFISYITKEAANQN